MTIAAVMVYVDPARQTEQQVRVARDIALKVGASVIGVSALTLPPPLMVEGVVVQTATEEEVRRIRTRWRPRKIGSEPW